MKRLLGLLLLALLASCFVRRGPHPPRGHYTLEQAQKWAERNNEARERNKRYYRAYPK